MKISKVSPERICVADNVVEGEAGIKSVVYHFDAFISGAPIEPSIVVGKKWLDFRKFKQSMSREADQEQLQDFYDSLSGFTSEDYLGIERFYRMVGATLAIGEVPVLEMRNNKDLARLLKDAKSGKIQDYGHEEATVQDLANSAIEYCFSCRDGLIYSVLGLTDALAWEAKDEEYKPGYLPERIVGHWNTTIRPRFERLLIQTT
jgi:hypothetical protein